MHVTTADPSGSTCTLTTTLDTQIPGTATERARAVWAVDQVAVNDGGADGDADTGDNAPFAMQGIFVP